MLNLLNIDTPRGEFEVFVAGDSSHPAIILLHGFPEDALSLELIAKRLVFQKYYVIVPNQRGYGSKNHSNKIEDYTIDNLSLDIIEILSKLQIQKTKLLGHDWGGIISWNLAENYPEIFTKTIILCAPHPSIMKKNLLTNPSQIISSWYIFLFQIPKISEALLSFQDYKIFSEDILNKTFNKKYDSSNLERIFRNLKVNKNLTFMLNWYRAMKYYQPRKSIKSSSPVVLFWGDKDPYLSKKMASQSVEFYPQSTLHMLKDVSHWPHHELEEDLVEAFLKYL